jgi:hypothetical protein
LSGDDHWGAVLHIAGPQLAWRFVSLGSKERPPEGPKEGPEEGPKEGHIFAAKAAGGVMGRYAFTVEPMGMSQAAAAEGRAGGVVPNEPLDVRNFCISSLSRAQPPQSVSRAPQPGHSPNFCNQVALSIPSMLSQCSRFVQLGDYTLNPKNL